MSLYFDAAESKIKTAKLPSEANLRIENLENKYVRTTRFESISKTSGTATLPQNSSVVLDDFGGTVDAVVSSITSGNPDFNPVYSSAGLIVGATFDSFGNYALTATPQSYPVAIIYRVRQQFKNFDSDTANIIGGFTLEQDGVLSEVNYIDLNINADSPSHKEGRTFYDKDAHTIVYYNDEVDVKMNLIGDGPRVRNASGAPIADGMAVKIGGHSGSRPAITLANSSDSVQEADAEGGYAIATHTIEDNSYGYVATNGHTVNGIDTLSLASYVGETWTEGNTLYVNPSYPGYYTNVRPEPPYHAIHVAVLIDHKNQGKLFVIADHQNALNKHLAFNGMEDKSLFNYSYNAATRVLTVTYTTGAAVWVNGKRFKKSGTEVATAHSTANGKKYFSYGTDGTLGVSDSPWDIDGDGAPAFIVYYKHNATPSLAKGILYCERHPGGIGADSGFSEGVHRYLHETVGSVLHSGAVISGYVPDTAGAASLSYAISSAELDDEDNHFGIGAMTDGGPYPIFWIDSASGTWDWDFTTSTTGILTDGTNIYYNNTTAGTRVAETNANRWINYWPTAMPILGYATGSTFTQYNGFIVIMGNQSHTSLANAQASTPTNLLYINNLTEEGVVFAKIIYARRAASSHGNAQIDVDPTYYRQNILGLGSSSINPSNHSALSGRSDTNSHPGTAVSIDASSFATNLTTSVTNVQLLANAVDTLTSGVSYGVVYATSINQIGE